MEEAIKRFLSIGHGDGHGDGDGDGDGYGDGDGDGSASGDGSGSGDGDGYGDGYGDGDGSGSGDGDGSGSGSGDGYGYGYGDGYGDGYGYGCGDGYGDGDGLESFGSHKVYVVDDVQTLIYSVRGNVAKAAIIGSDLTLKPCYVAKVGTFFAHGNNIREAVNAATDKAMQNMSIEERVAMFKKEFPDNAAKYPATKFFQWHNTLTGSCSMGRKQFMRDRGLSMDGSFTVAEFVELTKDSYGGDIIKKILS